MGHNKWILNLSIDWVNVNITQKLQKLISEEKNENSILFTLNLLRLDSIRKFIKIFIENIDIDRITWTLKSEMHIKMIQGKSDQNSFYPLDFNFLFLGK